MTIRRSLILSLGLLFPCTVPAQGRFDQSLSLAAGIYAASGIGSNAMIGLRYNYYVLNGRYFVEASLGMGSLESKVISAISKASLFDSNKLLTYEFSGAFDYQPAGSIPYVLLGVAGVRQGDVTSFAGVVGLGKRIPGLFGSSTLGFRYDVRDMIMSQRINNGDPFTVHNIVATVGLQVYF
jgi:hypothetical protein